MTKFIRSAEEYELRIYKVLNQYKHYSKRSWNQELRTMLRFYGLQITEPCFPLEPDFRYPNKFPYSPPIPYSADELGILEEFSWIPEVAVITWIDLIPERPVRIVMSAIRAEDGRIITGLRHGSDDMLNQIINAPCPEAFEKRSGEDQGFIDNYGIYRTRQDAYDIAKEAKQFLESEFKHIGHTQKRLFSEMVW